MFVDLNYVVGLYIWVVEVEGVVVMFKLYVIIDLGMGVV